MSKEFPLYPELPEGGAEEAQALIDKFKGEMKKVADEIIGDFYCDVACHIESDSWVNYKNSLMDGLQNYNNRNVHGDHDFKKIRQAILKEHREDIVDDLNQDMIKEIEGLKAQLEFLRKANSGRY